MILKDKKSNPLSRIAKYSFIFLFTFILLAPAVSVNACDPKKDPNCKPDSTGINTTKPDSTGINGVNITTGIKNPLGDSFKDIPTFIKGILDFVLLLGIPIVALAIIYCGFLFVTASGNSEKLKHAKQALLYTLVGAALLLGCLVITDAIKGTVDEIKTVDKAQNAK